jgi:hypothetical protein
MTNDEWIKMADKERIAWLREQAAHYGLNAERVLERAGGSTEDLRDLLDDAYRKMEYLMRD